MWGRMSDIIDVLLHRKPVKILLSIGRGNNQKYASLISKEANCTYSHTVKILNLFHEKGLIYFEKEGRRKIVKLTPKGNDLFITLELLVDKLEKLE